jgi:putative tRNA adenosine deaminase-associated protein
VETALPDIDRVVTGATDGDDEADEQPVSPNGPNIEPIGDADLLADLGMPAPRLIALCAQEGMLPADLTAEVCVAIGAGEAIDRIREA